jgi:hypothetical protein
LFEASIVCDIVEIAIRMVARLGLTGDTLYAVATLKAAFA